MTDDERTPPRAARRAAGRARRLVALAGHPAQRPPPAERTGGAGAAERMVFIAIFADQIATHEPTQDLPAHGARTSTAGPHPASTPSAVRRPRPQHLMGTDGNFRDEFSRVVYGAGSRSRSGFLTVGFAILIGSVIGAIAGYVGGMRRQRPDAAHGRPARVSQPAARDRDPDRPRARADQRPAGDRDRGDSHLCQGHARVGALDSRARLRLGIAGARRVERADCSPGGSCPTR